MPFIDIGRNHLNGTIPKEFGIPPVEPVKESQSTEKCNTSSNPFARANKLLPKLLISSSYGLEQLRTLSLCKFTLHFILNIRVH